MQYRREAKNIEAINGISKKCNDREHSCTENSDSSDEYEEDTHISYQFRRWANHIWSVSNNVTSRLRDLLRNNPSSTSATSDHSEASFLNESDSASWTSSNTAIESWDKIDDGDSNQRRYHQQSKNPFQTPKENYSRCSQKYYPVTETRRIRHVPDNRAKNTPAFIMGHKIATYPPVLILPRVHHGANQHSTRTGAHHSRHQTLRCHDAHGDQYADEWYHQYHRTGKQWGYERSRHAGYNYSAISERHEIPEKLSALTDDPKVKCVGRKSAKIEPDERDIRSVKHCSTHVRDFRPENYSNRHESISLNCATRRSKEESLLKTCRQKDHVDIDALRVSSDCFKTRVHSSPKKVAWDLGLSDNASQEPSYTNLPTADHPAKSYKALNTVEKKDFTENMEIPVKDNEKQQKASVVVLSDQDPNAVEASKISRDIQLEPSCHPDVPEKKSDEKRNDNLTSSNSGKWSSKNGVDSLLQSLRERMRTLSNVHPFAVTTKSDSMECNSRETTNLAEKECIVASCLASTCLPQCLENPHNIRATNEEGRPSFSERIQDIWQNGSEAWKSAPDHKTSTSSYDLHPGKNVSSKLSIFGLNGHPVLREYLGEHDSTVTLARILEKLIDSKTKTDSSSQRIISEAPKPPPRSCRRQSNTSPRVNVGVQKSVRTSTTACQEPALCSRHCSIERRKSRKRFRRTLESHPLELPIETSRPEVFSGRSIIPIPSIQFPAPVRHPIPNLAGLSPPSQGTRPSLHCYDDPVPRHRDFIIIDNPLIDESRPAPNSDPSPSTNGSSIGIKDGHQTSDAVELNRRLINKQGQFFSLVYEKIEQERHYAKSFDASQQHATVWPKEPKVLDEKRDPALEGVSAKPRSWWTKKFTFNKSGAFKDKMFSLFKYVTKKHTGVDCQTQKYYFDEAVTETVIPTPPIRVRRKSTISALKCSRSIQWDLDTSVSQYTETIDMVPGNKNEKLNKSTSVSLITQRVTMASGTNTDNKKPRKTSSKLFPNQKKEVSVGPKIIQDSKGTCTDPWNELRVICNQDVVESGVMADAEEKLAPSFPTDNKPSFKDILQSAEEDIKPLTDPVQKEEKHFTEEQKFKVSRSLSSKIPLATKPGSPVNALSRISRKRPSTAPTLDSLSSPLPLNESLRALEPEKTVGKEYASPNTAKKMLFKHNRSSLLRANNSMSKKSATAGHPNMWINTTWHKNIERKLVFKDLTSPVQIVEEKSFPDLSSTEATPCKKCTSEKLEDNENDSLPETSGHKTEGADSKNSSDEEAGNLELCKGEEPMPKDKTPSLDVRPCSSRASKIKENSTMNMQAQELLDDYESVIENSVNLFEETASCKTCPRLPDREDKENCEKVETDVETLPTQVNIREGKSRGSANFEESRGSNNIPYDSVNVLKLQIEKEPFRIENLLFQRQSESTFAFRVDRMRTTFNERTIEPRPQLAHSPCKTAKYSRKSDDGQAKKIPTLKQSERFRLLTKLTHAQGLPSSDLTPPSGGSALLLCKGIVPANNESNVSFFKSTDPTNPSENPKTEVLESEQLESKPMEKMTRAPSRVSENDKNAEGEIVKTKKARHRKTDAILGMVRKVLDEAIDKAVTVNRQTNFAIVSSSENIRQCISTNSEKSSDFSNDSLEAIQVRNTLNNSGDKLKVTVENSKKVMAAKLFEMDHYITQSIITFDLTEIADKPEKLRPSIFNVRLERSGEIARSKFVDSRKGELRHEKLSDTDSNFKVMDDENNRKSSQGGRNFKIDGKVLVEKVKSSIENGVPLKTITITDPAILIKHSDLIPINDKISSIDRNLKDARSKTKETLSKKLYNSRRDILSDTQSAGEGSQTTWASHENREIGIKNRNVPEIPTKSDSVEVHASEDHNNLASSMPSLKLTQKPTRFRGTLIPRYKKCPSTSQ